MSPKTQEVVFLSALLVIIFVMMLSISGAALNPAYSSQSQEEFRARHEALLTLCGKQEALSFYSKGVERVLCIEPVTRIVTAPVVPEPATSS